MWQFLRSPRRVLASLLAVGCLCLCGMIPYAYCDRPRVETASVEQGWMDLCLSARITVDGETFIYRTWIGADRKGGQRGDCDKLSVQLNSADFLQTYREAVIERHDRLAELFQAADAERLAFRCKRTKYITSKGVLEDFDGMVVCGVFSKRFSVHRPTYRWSGWLQARLPFMPDEVKLYKEADGLNRDASDVLEHQVRLVCPDLERVAPGLGWSES